MVTTFLESIHGENMNIMTYFIEYSLFESIVLKSTDGFTYIFIKYFVFKV